MVMIARIVFCCGVPILCAMACSIESPATTDESAARSTAQNEDVPLTREAMLTLAERTRLRFRIQESGSLVGGDATHGVEVTTGGVSITPYHWPTGRLADRNSTVAGVPLLLQTTGLFRGGEKPVKVQDLRALSDGRAAIVRESVVEIVQNVSGGIEQSWYFDSEPQGTGDLIVRISTSGQLHAGRTPSGIHFADTQSGLARDIFGARTNFVGPLLLDPSGVRISNGANQEES